MGYRSEVGILITVPAKVNSNRLLERLCKMYGGKFEDMKQFSDGENRFIYLHEGWVKWYEDSYDDVKAIMNFIYNWEDHYKTGGVHYVRIGEHVSDVDELTFGEPHQYINMERYLTLD